MGSFRHKTKVHSGTFRYIRVHSRSKRQIHMGSFRLKTKVHSGTFGYIRVHSRLFKNLTSHRRPRKRWEMRICMGSFGATTSAFYNIKRGQRRQGRSKGAEETGREERSTSWRLPLEIYRVVSLLVPCLLSLSLYRVLSLSVPCLL